MNKYISIIIKTNSKEKTYIFWLIVFETQSPRSSNHTCLAFGKGLMADTVCQGHMRGGETRTMPLVP